MRGARALPNDHDHICSLHAGFLLPNTSVMTLCTAGDEQAPKHRAFYNHLGSYEGR